MTWQIALGAYLAIGAVHTTAMIVHARADGMNWRDCMVFAPFGVMLWPVCAILWLTQD